MPHLLLIEDDPAICEMLRAFLSAQGFEVATAATGQDGLHQLYDKKPDCLLLDWMLPDISGIRLVKKIRSQDALSEIPVLMLTARAQEEDKVTGLEAGADDYLTKPVSLKELLARIRALLRRAQRLDPNNRTSIGCLHLDPETRTVFVNTHALPVAGKEFDLLRFFMQKPNRVFSRAQLLDHVWSTSTWIEERTVDVHIMRLRKILKPYQLDTVIETVRGTGYRLVKSRVPAATDITEEP